MHEMASYRFQVRCTPFEHLHIIICEFQPKHQCHLCLVSSHLPQYFSVFQLWSSTGRMQPALCQIRKKMRRGIKGREDRDVKLYYGYYVVARYLPAAGWAAHAPVAPNEPAWRDLCGNKSLCLSAIPDPSTHPLSAPPALSVTDQEQSAGPFLVAWLDWGRSLQLAGLSVTGGGGPQRLSLADTSDRQGTASADRFIKWHFLQLGLQKWGLGFVKSPSLQGPLRIGLDQSLVVMTNFLIWAVWNQLFSPL